MQRYCFKLVFQKEMQTFLQKNDALESLSARHQSYWSELSELEESFGVEIRDIFNHLLNPMHLGCRDLSLLHIISYQIAEYAAEILMTCVRNKRTAVSQHTYKS